MKRKWLGIAIIASLLLGGCAHQPSPQQMQNYYHAPSHAYSLSLSNAAVVGSVSLSEQCEPFGGSLNIWDSKYRFFRIDYLNFIEHPVVHSPAFATDRTLNDLVLGYYQDTILPKQKQILSRKVLFRDTVKSPLGEGLLTILSLEMDKNAVPSNVIDNTVYYGFFIFRRGDFAYIIQHRQEIYQPERMKAMLVALAEGMTIPGKGFLALDSTASTEKAADKPLHTQEDIDAWKRTMQCDIKKS